MTTTDTKSDYLKMLERRIAWCGDAYAFWTKELAENGDIKAYDGLKAIKRLWDKTLAQLNEYQFAEFIPPLPVSVGPIEQETPMP